MKKKKNKTAHEKYDASHIRISFARATIERIKKLKRLRVPGVLETHDELVNRALDALEKNGKS